MAKKLKIHSKDELVHDVIRKFDERSAEGFRKYGSTLRDDVDGIHRWLNDVQEELMDAILYLQKCKEMTTEMLEDRLLHDFSTDISSYPDPGQTCTMACDCINECKFEITQ